MASQPLNSDPTVEMGTPKQRAPKRPMSYWWPVGTFCTAVVLFIIGGGLAGAYYRHGHCRHYNEHNDHWDDWDYDWDDDDCKGPKAQLYAAGALLLIGLLVGLLGIILFVVYVVRRRRAMQATFYQATPLNDYGQYPQPMYPQQYDPYAPPFAQKPPAYPAQPAPYDTPPQPQFETSRSAEQAPHNPFDTNQEAHHHYGPPPASYH